MRLFGPPNVERLKDRRNIAGLVKALGYEKDEMVRRRAAKALGQIGDASAVEPLIAALKDEDFFVGLDAAKALGETGDASAVEPLIAALKDEDSAVGRAAAWVLGEIGDANAVKPVTGADNLQYLWAGEAVVEALARIGDSRAVEVLIAALNDGHRELRPAVARALGNIGDSRAVEPLVAALRVRGTDMRLAGGGTGGISAAACAKEVRLAATRALGNIGDARAVEALTAALKDKHTDVRAEAAEALQNMGWWPEPGEEAYFFLIRRDWTSLKDYGNASEVCIAALDDPAWETRRDAAGVLGEIGDSRAVDALAAALQDAHDEVRQKAAEALGNMDCGRLSEEQRAYVYVMTEDRAKLRECLHALVTASRTGHEPWVLYGLSMIEDPRAERELVAVMEGGGPRARRALDLLNGRREPEVRHVLCPSCDAYLGTRGELARRATGITGQMRQESRSARVEVISDAYVHCPECGASVLI